MINLRIGGVRLSSVINAPMPGKNNNTNKRVVCWLDVVGVTFALSRIIFLSFFWGF